MHLFSSGASERNSLLAVEAFPTWLWMARDVGIPTGELQSSSLCSCWVNHGFIPERKVGKLWELISVLSLSQRCRCAALFYILCKDDF